MFFLCVNLLVIMAVTCSNNRNKFINIFCRKSRLKTAVCYIKQDNTHVFIGVLLFASTQQQIFHAYLRREQTNIKSESYVLQQINQRNGRNFYSCLKQRYFRYGQKHVLEFMYYSQPNRLPLYRISISNSILFMSSNGQVYEFLPLECPKNPWIFNLEMI